MARTLYDALEVPMDADLPTIRAAYFRLLKRYHPDKAGPRGTRRTQEINAAYDVLKHPRKRGLYDEQLRKEQRQPPPPPPPGPDPEPESGPPPGPDPEPEPEPEPEPQPQPKSKRKPRASAARPAALGPNPASETIAIIGGACAAQIMGVAAGTVLVSAPGLMLFGSLAWAIGFDWSLVVFAFAHLIIGFFCAILAARIGLYMRPGRGVGQATFRFRVATFSALTVTLPVRGLMVHGAVNSWIALAMFLAGGAFALLVVRRLTD